jgi:hypothetical protein
VKTIAHQPTEALPFLIAAESFGHYCDFVCIECVADDGVADGVFVRPEYKKNGGRCLDFVSSWQEAEAFLHGTIRWNGCADLAFDQQERVMLHFCGRSDAAKVGKLLDKLYSLSAALIPSWNAELGK